MPIDVSEVILDGDLAQPFTILRSTDGKFVMGGWQDRLVTIKAFGVITVASVEQLRMVPEGDRVTGAMAFYSTQQLFKTHVDPTPGNSDILMWRGQKYRVSEVKPWADSGYWMAIGVRISGD
jgi:hypothetical protein